MNLCSVWKFTAEERNVDTDLRLGTVFFVSDVRDWLPKRSWKTPPPTFRTPKMSLIVAADPLATVNRIRQGGVFAVPSLRGGGEFGEAWHRAGMLQKKQNVFGHFFGAAEYLIAQGITSSKQLVISGTSNGGLLMGGAAPRQAGRLSCGMTH